MLNHISSPHHLTFSKEDDQAPIHPHNLALHIEVQIFRTRVHQVLVENGVGLNIISFNVIQQLGMFEFSINPRCKITIKSYGEVKRPSKGLIVLPTIVGLVEKDIIFQVLEIPLAYNLLLG